jgi:ParB family chromosome partitioning protein
MTTATASAAVTQGLGPIVVMEKLSQLFLASEAPKDLGLQVRKGNDEIGMEELEASVRTHGIITPLLIKQHKGKMYVTGGNRRLKVARKINGDIDAVIPTINSDDFQGDAREIAMATNVSLPPHPVDRYEIIATLVTEGMTPTDAQFRFGLTPRQFAQIMGLGGLSEKIRQHWRDGDIDGKTAQAFTLSSDPKEQDKIYMSLIKQSHGKLRDHDVRHTLVGQKRDEGKFVAFVGVDVCREAGILKTEDLFATSHTVSNSKKLMHLVEDKLLAAEVKLIADGWGWTMRESKIEGNSWSYGSVTPDAKLAKPTAEEKKRLTEIEQLEDDNSESDTFDNDLAERLENEAEKINEAIAARGYTPAQRAKAGCFLKIGHDGELQIETGKVKPQEAKKVAASERAKKTPGEKKKPNKPGEVTLSNALAARLSQQMQEAIASAVKFDPVVAVSAMIAAFASAGHIVDVRAGPTSYDSKAEENFAQVFVGAYKASVESKLVMLTEVVTKAISIGVISADAKPPIANIGLQAMIKVMNAKSVTAAIANAFDAKDYFGSISGDAVVDAVRTSMGEEHAAKVVKMDKAGKAAFATLNVPPTGWLPKLLRTVHYIGPTEGGAPTKVTPAKPLTPAKAVPAKKVAKKAKPAKKTMAKKKTKK